ncbi:MAG: hypothetical protein ACO1SX_28760 [Actinomycetota bacterium]
MSGSRRKYASTRFHQTGVAREWQATFGATGAASEGAAGTASGR